MMNPELLTLKRLTAGLVYPPLQIQPADLNRLYATITERYPYQSLQHLPDGVRMANPEGDCFIQIGRVQVNENVTFFEMSKQKCLDIFDIVERNLSIPQYLTFGVKLVAFLPMEGENAASVYLESRLFKAAPREWDILGSGRRGAGMRVVLHRDGVYDLRIEPFFNDLSQIYVELDVQHAQPFNGLAGIEGKMDAAYQYLFGEVKDFLFTQRRAIS